MLSKRTFLYNFCNLKASQTPVLIHYPIIDKTAWWVWIERSGEAPPPLWLFWSPISIAQLIFRVTQLTHGCCVLKAWRRTVFVLPALLSVVAHWDRSVIASSLENFQCWHHKESFLLFSEEGRRSLRFYSDSICNILWSVRAYMYMYDIINQSGNDEAHTCNVKIANNSFKSCFRK